MLFVPLPFVVAIFLLVLFVMVARCAPDERPNLPFCSLIIVSAFQSLLLGLRWGYGVHGVMFITPVVAATIPPLAYCGVAQLVRQNGLSFLQCVCLHAIPAVVIVVLLVVWRDAIDVALVLIFIGYALKILLLMRPGVDALRLMPFEGAVSTYRAIVFAASALLLSAALDGFVYWELIRTHVGYATQAVAIGNLVVLLVLSVAVTTTCRSQPSVDDVKIASSPQFAVDYETFDAIQELMEVKRIYSDAELSLIRLARKVGVPARQISNAINRATGKNVSQYVNDFRVAEACHLLTETEKSVTTIMLEVGFQTKSNFNREFRRVTDETPLAWRKRTATAK
jgi:AraC-like DNA-binding protein